MASPALPAPRIISPDELRDTAHASFVELTHAVRRYAHWALQLAYAGIREAIPLATDLLVEVESGPRRRCYLATVRDRAGDLLWSPGQARLAPADPLAGIDALPGSPNSQQGTSPSPKTGSNCCWDKRRSRSLKPSAICWRP